MFLIGYKDETEHPYLRKQKIEMNAKRLTTRFEKKNSDLKRRREDQTTV